MDNQLSLFLRQEGLGQDCQCRWFGHSFKELSDLGTSWKILRIVIITTDKARVAGFALIPILDRGVFRLLCLIIIFSLLILASPFFRFIFTNRGRLNDVHLRSFTGGSWRRRSMLNIRRNRLRVDAWNIMWLGLGSTNHTISCMWGSGSSGSDESTRTR